MRSHSINLAAYRSGVEITSSHWGWGGGGYLIDEAVNARNGMLHHFLEAHNLREANWHLHCDICSGQNDLLTSICPEQEDLSVFSGSGPHKVFVLLMLQPFEACVSSVKIGYLDTQHGQVVIPTYDWAEYFNSPFKQTGLKSNAPPFSFLKSKIQFRPRERVL